MLHTIAPPPRREIPSRLALSLSMTEEEALMQARLLQAIADPIRIRILGLLLREEGTVCVQEMVKLFDREQPTISHHLRILRDVGLVGFRRERLYIYYYVRKAALVQAWEIIDSLVNLV